MGEHWWSRTVAVVAVMSAMSLTVQTAAQADSAQTGKSGPSRLPATLLVSAPPAGATGPDDITRLAVPGVDHDRVLIWTAYQNGISATGSPRGATSTVAGCDPRSGQLERSIPVVGKVDGLVADPQRGVLYATVNEDANSRFNVIYPRTASVATYSYAPSPELGGNGGTDSIAVWHGRIVVSHSNPDSGHPEVAAAYVVTLDTQRLTARLTPLFDVDARAVNAVTGATEQLALTDPDTDTVFPASAPRFAGDFALISQADGEIVVAGPAGEGTGGGGNPSLTVLHLTDNVQGNVPPIDGLAVATSEDGALYVVDSAANTITRLNTDGWPAGTVFVSEPSDNNNPLIGTLDLRTGHITPLANQFTNPKGILFVPSGEDGGGA